jgi:hypothetical protein
VGLPLPALTEVLRVGYFGAPAKDFAVYGALFLALIIGPKGY